VWDMVGSQNRLRHDLGERGGSSARRVWTDQACDVRW